MEFYNNTKSDAPVVGVTLYVPIIVGEHMDARFPFYATKAHLFSHFCSFFAAHL